MLTNKRYTLFYYILLAYTFSVVLRLFWVYHFKDTHGFFFNEQFMINTNDGYYWAEGARDILSGVRELSSDRSPIDRACATLTAFFAKFLPFSFETVILYMPVFLSSLIVVPIMLIARALKVELAGFIASLLASIAWSYYNRTMVGYYDTDMLNIVLPMFLLWSLVLAVFSKKEIYLLITSLDIIIYRWWYPQSYSLEFAFWGVLFLFFLYLKFYKKDTKDSNFILLLLSFMMFAMMQVDGYIRFLIVASLYLLLKYKKELVLKHIYYLIALAVLSFLVSGGFAPIWGQLKGYVFRDDIKVLGSELKLHYYTVMKTIQEASSIDFTLFANRISGQVGLFFISLVGYIWFIVKKPVMLLSLPMVGLGFLALSSGLRFTIYAVPILAFGLGFLVVEGLRQIKDKIIRYVFLVTVVVLSLYPNIKHIVDYKVPTVFTRDEVVVLDKLKKIASRDDYVVSWWDYGYPIRYYADVKTLIDGGKHSGMLNFPVSFSLTYPQEASAKMQRLAVEYNEKIFEQSQKQKEPLKTQMLEQMILDQGYKNPDDFLEALQNLDIKLPKKTRDIYLYLPNRMLSIFSTVDLFSNLNLLTGAKRFNTFYYFTNRYSESRDFIVLSKNLIFDKRTNTLNLKSKRYSFPIKSIITTWYDKKRRLKYSQRTINSSAKLSLIYMKNYHQIIVLDERLLNSTYIQLFVFENYDKDLYEPVIMTPLVKVYKLKL